MKKSIKTFVCTTNVFIFASEKETNMTKASKTFHESCLYFTVNSLARQINEMAEEEFKITGLTPSHAYLMLTLLDEPGLSQNELSQKMNLKASTMTRFIDKLMLKRLVERIQEGRSVFVYPTEKGKELRVLIERAMRNMYERYYEVLDEDFSKNLTSEMNKANLLLKD